MRSLFKKLNTVLPSAEKKRIVALIVAMVIGGLMELAGVSAVFPLISIMTSEDGKLPAVLLRFLPESVAANRTELVVVLALALIVIYILKNLYIVKMYVHLERNHAYRNRYHGSVHACAVQHLSSDEYT